MCLDIDKFFDRKLSEKDVPMPDMFASPKEQALRSEARWCLIDVSRLLVVSDDVFGARENS